MDGKIYSSFFPSLWSLAGRKDRMSKSLCVWWAQKNLIEKSFSLELYVLNVPERERGKRWSHIWEFSVQLVSRKMFKVYLSRKRRNFHHSKQKNTKLLLSSSRKSGFYSLATFCNDDTHEMWERLKKYANCACARFITVQLALIPLIPCNQNCHKMQSTSLRKKVSSLSGLFRRFKCHIFSYTK